MDRKIGRKHLQIMREYVKIHFEDYYTFALRKFRKFYEKQYSLEEAKELTEKEILKYEEKNILDRISEFNRTGNISKRSYTPREKKNTTIFKQEYKEIKIIFD
tara:strand:+ start:333 stop:641 length:309 start_codon:yes stop_codon:yes gene_type:complete